MQTIRYRIEKGFEQFAEIIYNHRIKTVLVMAIVIGSLIAQLPKITFDTSTEGFLRDDDPALMQYNAFRDQFGRDEVIIVAIEAENVFDQDFLTRFRELHTDLEANVPYLDDIISLVNARNTRGEIDELIVEDLLEEWPRSEGDLERLKARVMENRMYRNMLISEDGRFTTIILRTYSHSVAAEKDDPLSGFDEDGGAFTDTDRQGMSPGRSYLSDEENSAVVMAVETVLSRYRGDDFSIYLAGSPVLTHFLKVSIIKDMRKFMALALITVAVLLYVMFRRITGVLLPMIVVVLSLLTTGGIMALTGTPIKVPTQVLPSFLLAVGVGTSVHILAIFFQRLGRAGDKKDAIIHALGHSGLAIVMTNVTTASGLMSFSASELAPIADVGIFAGVGVLLAFILTVILLPALLALFPLRTVRALTEKNRGMSLMDRFLEGVASFSTGHPAAILITTAIIAIIAVICMFSIRFSHFPLHWFAKANVIRMDTEKIDHELRGTISLEVIIDTGRENGLYDPDLLNRLEQAAKWAESTRYQELFVGKAWSLTTILKEINQALNENRPEFYTIPQDRELVAQEFLLFENSGSDDLEDSVDSRFSKARLSIKVPFEDAVKFKPFLAMVKDYFDENFPEAKITMTGMIPLLTQTINNAIRTMGFSYITALAIITTLMVILIGGIRIGLLSMVPNLTPILMMMGVIGAFSVPLDLFTMMVASIAIGLAVDDTIHFMHNFRRYYEQSGDPQWAVAETLHTTGRAMLVTTIVLSLGFFIFAFATMQNVINFGLLTGFTVLMALAADYLVAPALMVLVNKKKNI